MSEDEEPFDPLANLDQALRSFVDRARIHRAFYLQLVEQGFTEEQALKLTGAQIASIDGGA